MSHRRTGMRLTAGLAVLALALTACTDDSDGSDGKTGKDDKAGSVDFAAEWSVAGALAELPAEAAGDGALVQTADLAAALKASGLERTISGSREAVNPWLNPITGGPVQGGVAAVVFVPLPEVISTRSGSADEFAEAFGWSLVDVDSFAGVAVPPLEFTVVSGDFGDDTLPASLKEVEDGIVTDLEGEDFSTNFEHITAVNRLGRPTRLTEHDGLIGLGTSTPVVRAWRDGGATLADDQSLLAVADALDDEDVVSAVLTRVKGGGSLGALVLGANATPERWAEMADEIEALVPQDPYDAVGIGWGVDDGKAEVNVAYHFRSAAAAAAGAVVLEAAWCDGTSPVTKTPYADWVTVDDADVDGPVVTIGLGFTDASRPVLPYQMLLQREPLFVSR